MRHLITSVPLRGEYIPQGHVPINRAMVCLDCPTIFFVGPTCPRCASEAMIPLQTWIDREKPPKLGDRPRRYFEDGSGYEIDPKENRA